jgi:fluoroquinolone transport system ATP-binding protein
MIDVCDLAFAYHGADTQAVKGISFNIEKGEIFGFLGPSGAGKSTTQKILIGLLKGYQGEVRVMDKDLKLLDSSYYEHIGVSFELPNHYQKLTAEENLSFFRSLYSVQTENPLKLLDMVGLAADGNTRVSQFSKGMQMRLNFARSLLNRPELLFLDEPTTGLDPVNARKVKDIILGLKAEGRTVFLTTHDMNVADELCDRVAFIVEGQLSLIDSPRTLKLQLGQRIVRVEYQKNAHLVRQEFDLDGLGNNEEFLHILRNEHIETLHTEEASLENIFIQVTGRSLT